MFFAFWTFVCLVFYKFNIDDNFIGRKIYIFLNSTNQMYSLFKHFDG